MITCICNIFYSFLFSCSANVLDTCIKCGHVLLNNVDDSSSFLVRRTKNEQCVFGKKADGIGHLHKLNFEMAQVTIK